MTTHYEPGRLAVGQPIGPDGIGRDEMYRQPHDRTAGITTVVTFGQGGHPESASMQNLQGGPPTATVVALDYRGAAQPEMAAPGAPANFGNVGQQAGDISPSAPGQAALVTPGHPVVSTAVGPLPESYPYPLAAEPGGPNRGMGQDVMPQDPYRAPGAGGGRLTVPDVRAPGSQYSSREPG